MIPLTADQLRGNWATLLLPIGSDETIEFELLTAEIDHFIQVGVDGIYSNGSAGEFYTQNETEFDRVSALLAEKCERAQRPFQIGACHTSPQISRERIRRGKTLRPSAFQVILPDWFIPTFEEILSFLDVISAEAAPLPLVLYNPPHAKRQVTPEEWAILAERFPALIGIKVPGGGAHWYQAMQPVLAKLSVFIPGHLLSEGLAQGARGTYSNVTCLSPTGAQQWYQRCRDHPAEGKIWASRIKTFWLSHVAPLITQHGLSNMAADKAAAAAGGWLPGFCPTLRWPYRSATPEMVAALAQAARQELPEWFSQS